MFEPALILKQLHLRVKEVLKQESKEDIADGMDICLCRMDLTTTKKANTILFAGAKRPLWVVGENKLINIKGDRKSIGGRQREEQRIFSTQKVEINSKDMIYLVSDGFADQGNPDGGTVKVNWYYDEEDEDIQETGEELCEDLHLPYELIPYKEE